MIRRSLVTAALLIFASATALAQPMTKPDPGATIRSEPPPTSAGQAVGSCNSKGDKPNSNFSCARLKAACEGAGYKYSPSKPDGSSGVCTKPSQAGQQMGFAADIGPQSDAFCNDKALCAKLKTGCNANGGTYKRGTGQSGTCTQK
ncbi:hypothetical protein [Nitrobacter vulgaris]|uniref:Uncharacterized protein n=1 Tax=Nitrobacter vulgaris TaxID=29421 RepID=A0A1V4HZ98_NITVU|nr:hypothetical protein [Nitrobacter vulgaris]OPH83224.1 hypothetical protein B2M20_08040 [Nitrobacter vulgaris]